MTSAAASQSMSFLAILAQKDDGLADVCHVGNGPTSPANATLIAAMRNAFPALLAEVRELRESNAAHNGRLHMCRKDRDAARAARDAALASVAKLRASVARLTKERDEARAVLVEAIRCLEHDEPTTALVRLRATLAKEEDGHG